jgi:hypothetical protein
MKIFWLSGITVDRQGKLTHYTSDGKGGLVEEEACPECEGTGMNVEEIIRRGDRVDFKLWLKRASDKELCAAIPKVMTCTVQDFTDRLALEMRERGIIR